MLSRQTRSRVARLMLAMLLAGQAMLAFAACEWSERSAARAVISSAASEPCHDGDQDLSANLCFAHCAAGSQSLDKPAVKVFALAAAPVLIVQRGPVRFAARASELPLPVAAPPPRILFRTLLI